MNKHRVAIRAFTLVEILVVMAIIALLVGLLIPLLARSRAAARGSICQNQLREVARGWHLYANDNNGIIVPGQPGRYSDDSRNVYNVGNGFQYRPRWYVQLGAKNGIYAFTTPDPDPSGEHSTQITNKVFICPETSDWTSTRNCSYGYNYQFLGNTRFRGDDESRGFVNYPVNVGAIDTFDNTVMAADCLGTAAGKAASDRTPNQPDGSRNDAGTALGGHGYALDPPRLTNRSDFADTRLSSPEHRSGPDERHAGQATVAFCDGHVESITALQMGYFKNSDGSIAFDGAGTTNARFSGSNRDVDPPPAD